MMSRHVATVLFSVIWAWTGATGLAQVKPTLTDIARQQSQCVVMIGTVDQAGKALAIGSGFVVRADGIIATNHHVIDGAFGASVRVGTGDIFDGAMILDSDLRRDLALLKIKALNLQTCRLGDSDVVEIGQHVIAIGNPKGLSQTVSDGIVSAVRQMPGYRMLQLTAPISHGSSGGPLLNDRGQVIGVTTSGIEEGQNLNFAIPVNYLKPMVASLDLARSKTLGEYNAGRPQAAKQQSQQGTPAGSASPPGAATTAAKSTGSGEGVPGEIQKKGIMAYLRQALGAWTEEQAKGVLGEPTKHRFAYDKNKTLDGDIYAYKDPTRFVQYVELGFDIKTKKVRSVSFNKPLARMTWNDCKKAWGDNFVSINNADGSKMYRYRDRGIDVVVDKDENVMLIGIY